MAFYPKRGQATLYLVVALIVVMTISLAIFFLKPHEEKDLEKAPPDYRPVLNYLKSCLKEASKSAIREVSASGGFSHEYLSKFSVVPGRPTLSQGVFFPAGSNTFLPYWYYMASPDSCTAHCEFKSQVPTLFLIKRELASLIKKDMESCVKYAPEILKGFKIQPMDEPSVNITLNPNVVITDLNYPLRIFKEGSDNPVKLEKIRVSVRAPLLRMYYLAKEITGVEMKYSPFEKDVLDIISAHSGLSEDKFPPSYALLFGYHAPVFWNAFDVKNKLSNLMAAYTNLFTLNGSKNYKEIKGKTKVDSLFWERFALQLYGVGGFNDISYNVYFDPSWNYYLTFGGNFIAAPESTLGKKSAAPGPSSLLPISRYIVPYDISLPLVISLRNDKALEGEGLTFNFALELNIRASEPFRSDSKLFAGFQSFLCLPENYQSKNYTIKVVDSEGRGVDGAIVSFSSGGQTCPIGKTDDKGEIHTRMPCGLGYLSAVKKGYLSNELPVLIEPTSGETLKIKLLKERTVKASVMKYVYDTRASEFNSRPLTLGKDDFVIITLDRISLSGNQQYSRILVFNGSKKYDKITLVPGDYKISGFLLNMKPVTIPEKNICVLGAAGLCAKKVTLPSFKMNSSFLGEVSFNETMPWHYDGTTDGILTFYIFALDSLKSYDDLELLGDLDKLMREHLSYLKPKFVRGR